MGSRSSSPILVGRDTAIAELWGALDAVETDPRRVILVEGEAGIGKTRVLAALVADLAGRSPATQVLSGRCIELGQGALPYGAIAEILDELGHASTDPLAGRALRLRDHLSGALNEPAGEASAESRGRVFIELRDVVVSAAGDQPLLLIIDDLHWADQSTLDVIAYLSSRLVATPIVLVLAYRSDEIDRRHPLRPLLAALQRGSVLSHVALGPLGEGEIWQQAAAILGDGADDAFVRRVVDLADGNPFHVEELLALGGPWASLPASLRSVMLARIERLDEAALSVVREAAVIGREVDEELLSATGEWDPTELREALRSAVDEFIFVPTADGRRYRFRHALLREAVYDDLLPADRIALHRRVADVLDAGTGGFARSPVLAAVELARHRDAGLQVEAARHAFATAGDLAMRARAWNEAASAFDRVLELDASLGRDLDGEAYALACVASRALWYAGKSGPARALLESTLDRAGPRIDPLDVGAGWIQLANLLNDIGEDDAAKEATDRARAITPRHPPNPVRVQVMGSLASHWMIVSRSRRAVRLATCVIAMADAMGLTYLSAEARAQRGPALLALGRIDEARRDAEVGRAYAESPGDPWSLGVVLFNFGGSLFEVGAFEEGLAQMVEASAIGTELGMESSWHPWVHASAASYSFWLGRWDEADRHLAIAESHPLSGQPLSIAAYVRAMLAAHRQDDAKFSLALADSQRAAPNIPIHAVLSRIAHTRNLLLHDDPESAMEVVAAGLSELADTDDLSSRTMLATLGAEAAADAAERQRARRDATTAATWAERSHAHAAFCQDLSDGRIVRDSIGSPITIAHAAAAAAHASRAAGIADPEACLRAADAYDDTKAVQLAAWARYRVAEAALTAGDPDLARRTLIEASTTARRVGDAALTARIEDLARRARIDLVEATGPADDRPQGGKPSQRVPVDDNPWHLTDREMEVLGLVAEGLTNREISRRLFITEKTASSHVTHILDKLGVSSRTEAALAAARSGVLPPD